jgi:crotonobetainyl-CoA:carnitine CoA-transferase CaiB-like acyl-CoA transferase
MSNVAKPLSGTVVVEIGGSLAAPFAGQVLGDLGAEVIKVERAQGDDSRQWGSPYVEGSSTNFHVTNRNKYSVVADLRNAEERDRLIAMIVESADVVLQNLRPGQVEAVGVDSKTLRALKPSLIYCNLSAFGRTGPLADRPGYDPLMQAFGGIMSVMGEEGRPPVRVGPSIVDCGTGLWAVIGIVSALMHRRETGEGATVDVSLLETAMGWMMGYVPRYLINGEIAKSMGSGQVGLAPYRAFKTSDGYLVVAAGNDGLFRKLCATLGRPEWVADARFATNPDRFNNRDALNELVEAEMINAGNDAWRVKLEAAGVPCAPVNNVRDMVEHEQTRALGMIGVVPGTATVPQTLLPISFDGERPTPRMGAPKLGEHTEQFLGKRG